MAVVVLSRGGDSTGRPSLTVSSSEWGWAVSSSCHRAPLSFPEERTVLECQMILPLPACQNPSMPQCPPSRQLLFMFPCENLIKSEVGAPSCPSGSWALGPMQMLALPSRTAEPTPPQVWHPRDSVETGTEIVSPPREAGTAGELLFLMANLG